MLGEFFAARPEDIDETVVEGGPHGRFPTVEAKGLSPMSLATLGEIVGVGQYVDVVARTAEGPQAKSGEAGLFTVPREVRDALATADNLDVVAENWAATDELTLDRWPTDDALAVLRDLAQLTRQARQANHDIWYWWSL